MREILFKAKRIDNGEWVEGHYYSQVYHEGTIEEEWYHFIKPIGSKSWESIRVKPETICQYTGLTDKNGKKIWENDIIQDEKIQALGKVEYIEDSFYLNDVHDGKQYIEGFWNSFEIIGNIFDNPELLKGGD